MDVLLLVVVAMLVAVLLVGVGDRLHLPWPVLMLVIAAGAAFVPGVDAPDLDPELILPLFLPPLLYATAQRTSWALFRARWRSIAFLAVGLVLVTVAAVAGTVWALVPGIGVAATIALGAAVAPPDPVAVEAVAGTTGMPRRLVATLQSEGLFNDAISLVIFQTAVAAAVAGDGLGVAVLGRFAYGLVVAVVVGLVAARLVAAITNRLTDATATSALTLVLPFAVYLGADALGASGVIAVVVAALQTRSHADADASEERITGRAFWNVVEMLVTGVAFALIGLELRGTVLDARDDLGRLLAHAAVVCAVVVGVRAAWMALSLVAIRRSRRLADAAASPRTPGEAVVLAWSGMRGLATLALALAIPTVTASGAPFPDRAELVLTATSVLVVTLVLPGLTLPLLLRALGMRETAGARTEAERRLMTRARRAAIADLDAVDRATLGVDDEAGEQVLADLRTRFARLAGVLPDASGAVSTTGSARTEAEEADYHERLARLRRRREQWSRLQEVGLAAARREVLTARSEAGTDPQVADRVLRRLDVRSLALPGE